MPITLSQEDLKGILTQVEASLDQVLKSEASSLSSSSSSMSKDEESGKSPDVSDGSAEGSSPGEGGPPMDGAPADGGAPPMEGTGAPAEAPPMDPAAASPAPAAPAASPAGPAEGGLESQLAAMPPDQLRHLYMAAKAALFQQLGGQQDPAAAGAAPAMASPAAASPMPAGAPPAMKAEGDPDQLASDGKAAVSKPALKQDVFAAAKAEGDPDKLASDGKAAVSKPGLKQDVFAAAKKSEQDAQIADLQAQIEGLTKAVTLVLGQPLRKAVTGLSQIQKTGTTPDVSGLSKAEITAKLKDVDFSKLQKKDREAINGFYDGRNGPEKLAHLFATK